MAKDRYLDAVVQTIRCAGGEADQSAQQLRRKWTYRRSVGGRPPIAEDVRDLILRLGRENPRWGCVRIKGELAKRGIRISATAIRTLLRRRGLGPAPRRPRPTWGEFLRTPGTRGRRPWTVPTSERRPDPTNGLIARAVEGFRAPQADRPMAGPDVSCRHLGEPLWFG